jgi:hypothetical protein
MKPVLRLVGGRRANMGGASDGNLARARLRFPLANIPVILAPEKGKKKYLFTKNLHILLIA